MSLGSIDCGLLSVTRKKEMYSSTEGGGGGGDLK